MRGRRRALINDLDNQVDLPHGENAETPLHSARLKFKPQHVRIEASGGREVANEDSDCCQIHVDLSRY